MSVEAVRITFERWLAAATAGTDLLAAVMAVCAPDCVVHTQNGQVGGLEITESLTTQARALYPDLSIEIEHVLMTDDRMLVQVTMSGKPSLIFRIARGRRVFHAIGAMVARVNERSEIVELWPYLNPAR